MREKETQLSPPEIRPRPTEPEIRPRPSEPGIRRRPELMEEGRSAGSVAVQFLDNVNIGAGLTVGGYLVHETAKKVNQTLSSNEKPKEK